ncbi:MAG: hypothetical protein PHY74_04405 [Candidatus Bathyarchaeota archaeon]|nr:hypothetical protein [Candidatus Bathyarchaeota archaeon]MDD4325851.1 hypothetical protein [Candidatus Bathyarchaeota archaeon]MDI9577328.1 hypothetical protein [Thermoproteota archaeon]MDT8782134.1 hypothetical protein [Candidatus Bathyarchaeota archaeon]NLD66085.1 hypothetical protein [Thermoproteota archaeon]
MNNSARFATVINCMDGRTQLPIINYMRTKFNVDYVDNITEPGPVKVIAEQSNDFQLRSIQQRVMISQDKHGSKHLALVAHYDCTGNHVEKNKQIEQLRKSLETIRLWGFKGMIVGLWVNENWQVEEITFNR